MSALLAATTLSGCAFVAFGQPTNVAPTAAAGRPTATMNGPTSRPTGSPSPTPSGPSPSSPTTTPSTPPPGPAPGGYHWDTVPGVRLPVPDGWSKIDPSTVPFDVNSAPLKQLAKQLNQRPESLVNGLRSSKGMFIGPTGRTYTPVLMLTSIPSPALPSDAALTSALTTSGATQVKINRLSTPAGASLIVTFTITLSGKTIRGATLLVDTGGSCLSIQTGSLDGTAKPRLEAIASGIAITGAQLS